MSAVTTRPIHGGMHDAADGATLHHEDSTAAIMEFPAAVECADEVHVNRVMPPLSRRAPAF